MRRFLWFGGDGKNGRGRLLAKAKCLLRDAICSLLYVTQMYRIIRFVRDVLGQPRTLMIFAYHKINDDRITGSWVRPHVMGTPLRTFARQMAYLCKRHNVIPLDEAVRVMEKGERLPRNAVSITFDDGYRDNYTNAYPILRFHRLPATFFLTTGFIDCKRPNWQVALSAYLRFSSRDVLFVEPFDKSLEQLAEAGRNVLRSYGPSPANASTTTVLRKMLRLLTPDIIEQIADDFIPEPAQPCLRLNLVTARDRAKARESLAAQLHGRPLYQLELLLDILRARLGLKRTIYVPFGQMMTWQMLREMAEDGMSFGAHTCTHPILTRVSRSLAEKEIVFSKKRLEAELKKPVMLFSYPNGKEDDFDPETVGRLKRAGFAAACSMIQGSNTSRLDPFSLKRISTERNIAVFAMRASGILR